MKKIRNRWLVFIWCINIHHLSYCLHLACDSYILRRKL